jgi:hypothetical protein
VVANYDVAITVSVDIANSASMSGIWTIAVLIPRRYSGYATCGAVINLDAGALYQEV